MLSPALGEEQPLAPAEAEMHLLESSFAGTALADRGPNVPLQNRRTKAPRAAWGTALPACQGRCSWSAGSCSGNTRRRKMWSYWRESSKAQRRLRALTCGKRLRNLGLLILERWKLSEMLSMCTNTQLWGMRKSQTLLSGDNWLEKNQWAKTEIVETQFKHKKTPFTMRESTTWTGSPGKLWSLHCQRYWLDKALSNLL